jgi:hypothetical protein
LKITVETTDFSAASRNAVLAFLRQADFDVGPDVDPFSRHDSRAYFNWVLEIVAPIAPFFAALVAQIGKRAGDDLYDGLKLLVRRAWEVKSPGAELSDRGQLVITDTEVTGRDIVIQGEPPSDDEIDAARQLGFENVDGPVRLYGIAAIRSRADGG